MSRAQEAFRRVVDLAVAACGLLIAAPVGVVVALVVRVRMGSPVLFRQCRLGLGGVPFDLYKFRSMRPALPGREAPEFDHERLGRLGRMLRVSSLDELPSLLNLLRGDLTLVGPRPLPQHYWPRFSAAQRARFEVKPGITGLAQVSGRNRLDWPQRLALDVSYVQRRSLWLDLRLLARTVPTVFSRAGVNDDGSTTSHELPIQ